MKVASKNQTGREIELTVEVPSERVDEAMQAAARKLSRRMKIPGFRPGKAPYPVVLLKVGEEQVFDEALDDLGQVAYKWALDEAEVDPYAPGALEEVVSRQPLVLRYKIPLSPEVDLGSYRELRLDYPQPEVTDEAVDKVMEDLRLGQALIEPADRPAALGDVIVLNVDGQLLDPQAGDKQRLLSEKGVSVLVDSETDWPIAGIADHLLGLPAGEKKSIEYTFPDDYRAEDLRGKPARFELECLEVKSRIVPEWTDDLAKGMGEFESLLDLRIKVRQQLQDQQNDQTRAEYAQQVIEKAVEGAAIQYPPVLLEQEIDDMVHDLGHQLERQKLTLDDYLKVEGKTIEQVREELKPQAENRLQRALVLGKIVDLENLQVGENEIDSALDRIVAPLESRSADLRKRLNTPSTRRSLTLDLLTDRAIERLVSIARGEAPELNDGAAVAGEAQEPEGAPAAEAAAAPDSLGADAGDSEPVASSTAEAGTVASDEPAHSEE